MLTSYVDAALRRAKYKILLDNEGYFGEIPGFKGLWASAPTLGTCRDELQMTLESWLLAKLRHNDRDLPVLNRINLNTAIRKQRVA